MLKGYIKHVISRMKDYRKIEGIKAVKLRKIPEHPSNAKFRSLGYQRPRE